MTIYHVWNKAFAQESLAEDPENPDDILAYETISDNCVRNLGQLTDQQLIELEEEVKESSLTFHQVEEE